MLEIIIDIILESTLFNIEVKHTYIEYFSNNISFGQFFYIDLQSRFKVSFKEHDVLNFEWYSSATATTLKLKNVTFLIDEQNFDFLTSFISHKMNNFFYLWQSLELWRIIIISNFILYTLYF